MRCASNAQSGFTLVEISIVMIIIGLLIGGTFGGMKLVEISEVSRTIRDLSAIDSGALTFKDTFGRLPGDIASPSTRLPNCTSGPCSRGGDGNRILGVAGLSALGEALTTSSEKFTMWSQLAAAGLIDGPRNEDDMEFGAGQMASPIGGGYRLNGYLNAIIANGRSTNRHTIYVTNVPSALIDASQMPNHRFLQCSVLKSIDTKIDDAMPHSGIVLTATECQANIADQTSEYGNPSSLSSFMYLTKF